MSDMVIFVAIFGGFFVLRGVAATMFFLFLLPGGDHCPHCNAHTLRVERARWSRRLLPKFRASWCYVCGWEGWLRDDGTTTTPIQSGQFPLISKKSS